VKKNLPIDKDSTEKRPKTELDVKFLAAIKELMSKRGIRSDRAMSIELGRSPDFLNRVRNGYQSATPEAWSALFDKYPEAQNITTNVMAQGGGQAIGTNHGIAHQTIAPTGEPVNLEGASKVDLLAIVNNTQLLLFEVKIQNEQLKSQLADKERIIKLLEQSLNKAS
jgi:hypothetical protein